MTTSLRRNIGNRSVSSAVSMDSLEGLLGQPVSPSMLSGIPSQAMQGVPPPQVPQNMGSHQQLDPQSLHPGLGQPAGYSGMPMGDSLGPLPGQMNQLSGNVDLPGNQFGQYGGTMGVAPNIVSQGSMSTGPMSSYGQQPFVSGQFQGQIPQHPQMQQQMPLSQQFSGASAQSPNHQPGGFPPTSIAHPFEMPKLQGPHSLMERRPSMSASASASASNSVSPQHSPPTPPEQLQQRAAVMLAINRELLRHAVASSRGSEVHLAAMKRLQSNLSYLQALTDPARVAAGIISPPLMVPPPELPTLVEPYQRLAEMFMSS